MYLSVSLSIVVVAVKSTKFKVFYVLTVRSAASSALARKAQRQTVSVGSSRPALMLKFGPVLL